MSKKKTKTFDTEVIMRDSQIQSEQSLGGSVSKKTEGNRVSKKFKRR